MGVTVTRIGHENRFGTAALIMDALPDSDEAFVVEGRHADPGRGWPDALSASGLAAAEGKPVLLVDHANLPEETANTVSGDLDVIIVGGPAAISGAIAAEIDQRAVSRRIFGADRHATSLAMVTEAQARGISPAITWLATGRAFPDGLVSSSAAGTQDSLLLLIDGLNIDRSPETLNWLSEQAAVFERVNLADGPNAISVGVESQLRQLVTDASR
jgi:hypothetical protein